MGLYDSYKPTNSVRVKEFAGSIAGDLADAKKQLNEQYLMGMETEAKTRSALADASNLVHEEDAQTWANLNAEAENQIRKITEKGDYANAVGDLYSLSNKVTQRLKPLVTQKKAIDEFTTRIEDPKLNLSEETKNWYRTEAKEAMKGGTKFDASGRVLNPFTPPVRPVENIDNVKRVQEILKGVGINSDSRIISVDELGQTYKVQEGSTITEIPVEKVDNALRQGLYADKNWQESIRQDAGGRTHSSLSNLDETGAAEFLKNGTPLAETARVLVESGQYTPKQALKKVQAEQFEKDITKTILDYGKNSASRQTSSKYEKEPSYSQKLADADARAAAKAASGKKTKGEEGSSTMLGVGYTSNVKDWAPLGDQVLTKGREVKQNLSDLKAKRAKAELQLKGGTEETRINAEAEMRSYDRQIKALEMNSKYITQAENRLVDDAIAQLYPNQNLKSIERDAKWKNVFSKFTSSNVLKDDAGKAVTVADIFRESVDKDNYQILQPASGEIRGQGVPSGKIKIGDHVFSGARGWQLINALENPQSNQMKQVYDKVKSMSTEGIAVRSTAVPITKAADKEAIKSLLKYPAAYDMANSSTVATTGFDWGKAEGISYIPELDRISVTVPDAEGKPTNILVDASETRVSGLVGNMLSSDENIDVKALGYAMKSGDLSKYLQALDQSGAIIRTIPGTVGADGKEKKLLDAQGNEVGLKRVRDGSVVLVDKNGKILRDMQTIQEAVSLFEISKNLQK